MMLTTTLSEQVFKLGASSPAANALLFEQLAARTHEVADLMGHGSYAHYQLSDGMLAACPEAVTQFLDTLGEYLRPQVRLPFSCGYENVMFLMVPMVGLEREQTPIGSISIRVQCTDS